MSKFPSILIYFRNYKIEKMDKCNKFRALVIIVAFEAPFSTAKAKSQSEERTNSGFNYRVSGTKKICNKSKFD